MTTPIVPDTDEIELLRESVAGIAAKYGHSYYRERAAQPDGTAHELWAELATAGFTGVNIPAEYGGGGAGITELAVVCEEVAAAGCPLLLLLVSPAICGSIIAQFGSPEQRREWLPLLAGTGDPLAKMAFAITESDAGSNSHRVATTAVHRDDAWVLNGSKTFISGVDEAEAVLVVARTGSDAVTGRGELSLFVVDSDAPGLERHLIETEVVAPERQYTMFFDDVAAGEDRLIGKPGEGLRQLFAGLNPERILGAALLNGIGRYALERATDYANDRQVWDVPIGRHQGVAHPLAEAKIQLEQARLMTWRASTIYDQRGDAGEASNMAKFAAAEAALACLDRAIQTHGGNGMTTEYGLASMWGMARLLRIAPVSREMILNYVAQHSLRLPKSY